MANGVSRTRSSTRKPANNRRTNKRATSINRTKQATQTNKTQNTGRTESRDKLSLSKPEEKPRNDFVNPLENFDKATEAKQQDPNAKSGGDSKASETGKPPEGVNKEQAGQVAQQIQDFSALATHLPTILGMGDQIREGGISSEHVEALKAAYGPMKGVLTPENIQAFKGMDLEAVDKLLRFYPPDSLQAIPTSVELKKLAQDQTTRAAQEAARAEQEAARAEKEAARAEKEAARAEKEAARAEKEAAKARLESERADREAARVAELERQLEELRRRGS